MVTLNLTVTYIVYVVFKFVICFSHDVMLHGSYTILLLVWFVKVFYALDIAGSNFNTIMHIIYGKRLTRLLRLIKNSTIEE